jgi:hypothetical protein
MESQTPSDAVNRLRDVLLRHLGGAGAWPGCDGLTVGGVLDCYPEGVAAGTVPDWQQLLGRHPELTEALHAWLAAKDRWQFAVRGPGPAAAGSRISGIADHGPAPKHVRMP